jgi:predicted  nucleic acid-binding Zn-ribbon protein
MSDQEKISQLEKELSNMKEYINNLEDRIREIVHEEIEENLIKPLRNIPQ